jgi:hypothetical protein
MVEYEHCHRLRYHPALPLQGKRKTMKIKNVVLRLHYNMARLDYGREESFVARRYKTRAIMQDIMCISTVGSALTFCVCWERQYSFINLKNILN